MPPHQPVPLAFAAMTAEIGVRVRSLREERGITLSSLALTTGLGKGTLSELERGQRNPTLDTLFAITTALALPLSALLGPSDQPQVSDHDIEATLLARWEEHRAIVEAYRMTVAAGTRRSRAHAEGVQETLTVIRGRIRVGPDDAPIELTDGQSHTFPADVDHHYQGMVESSSTVLLMQYPVPASSTQRSKNANS
ncbi:helix-turn-helix domain-containing protein [Microbacterium sp. SLBN-146]|uniref:helix-turn-helix domain-containing protein n=1 Tax=Microbacterium sp. SLBN-146 TaxID=2768457 RepID=UPI00114EE0D0|nr:XRE family transcriptional regulator [Microbacterium sp. SLBN-146]TQJ32405.1 XRE family transcriptional regulator [Microbacterium sp. SLBN-146]